MNNYEDLIIKPSEQFRDRKRKRRPPKLQRPPPPPPQQPKYDYPFSFHNDIFQTKNESLENSKLLMYKAYKIRNSNLLQMNSK